jgi:hypothetical protein
MALEQVGAVLHLYVITSAATLKASNAAATAATADAVRQQTGASAQPPDAWINVAKKQKDEAQPVKASLHDEPVTELPKQASLLRSPICN